MRTARWVLGGLALAVALAVSAGGCLFAAPGYDGPVSDHFDGKRFHSQQKTPEKGFSDFLRWRATSERGPWRQPVRVGASGDRPPQRVTDGSVLATWVGHSTVLLQMDGVNILTDPIWSERASPVSFAGPERVHPPGLRYEELPPIDVVVISHNHYDHLDVPTLKRLHRDHQPRIIAGLGNGRLFEEEGIGGWTDLDWWQELELKGGLRITGVPAQHWSSRGLFDQRKTLWLGFVVQGPSGTVYYAGDTGWGPHFQQVRDRFGPVRLAVLPIGAFQPRWFMKDNHINPSEAVKAHRVLEAERSLAVHYGTFPLADDGQDEPIAELRAALKAQRVPAERFWALGFGEARLIPSSDERVQVAERKAQQGERPAVVTD